MNSKIPNSFRALSLAAATGCFVLALAGCNGCNSGNAASTAAPITNGQDPASANMADSSYNAPNRQTAVMGQQASYTPQQSSESYGPDQQPPAPIVNGYANTGAEDTAYNAQDSYNDGYDQGAADEQESIYSDQAPPPLPEYDQPYPPGDNYLWTPGYWGWGTGGYYWIPGAWVIAPYYGALWTPPYWGWYRNHYYFHHGYWGPHVGFYGGINYGYGYIGTGYWGGYWRGHDFYYNRAVNRIGSGWGGGHVYERPVMYNNVRYGMQPNNRVSFNGGRGGIDVRPRPFEVTAMHERHEGPTSFQQQAHREAATNRSQFFNVNHGLPAEAAASRAYGRPTDIRATPEGVRPGRPGMNGNSVNAAGRSNGFENHGGTAGANNNNATAHGFAGEAGRSATENHGAAMTNRPGVENRPGTPNNATHGFENRGAEGNRGTQQQHTFDQTNRPTGVQNHLAPVNTPHSFENRSFENRSNVPNAGRGATENRSASPIHSEAPRSAAPQMRATPQVREAPQQMRAAPQMHEAPRAAPAPQVHQAPAPHPMGGGGARPAGGGGEHEGHR